METVIKKSTMTNSIDVTQLLDLVEQIQNNPEFGKFSFRTANKWQDGTMSHATVKEYYGALQNDTERPVFGFDIDEPPILLGKNLGANPVEYLLVGLSGCLTTAIVVEAATQGIHLDSVESTIEGALDLRGFLGLAPDIPVGYQRIKVRFKIDAEIKDEKKQELIDQACKSSPSLDTIVNPVQVDIELVNH